jgi:hypothetical protein
LQAVAGVALAAIGLWYDDYTGSGSPVTTQLTNVLGFNAGVTHNDTTFKPCFPYVQEPWPGFTGSSYSGPVLPESTGSLQLAPQLAIMNAYPNPFKDNLSFRYRMDVPGAVKVEIMDISGRLMSSYDEGYRATGEYIHTVNTASLPAGNYIAVLSVNNVNIQSAKLLKQ